MRTMYIPLVVVVALTAGAAEKDAFDLKVERVRLIRNQPGNLHIDAQGITFQSSGSKIKH